MKQVVLVGGGHAHALVLREFGERPVPGMQVTLVSRGTRTAYSGMLPGFIAGHYREEDCHIDLPALARFAGATFLDAEAVGLDRAGQRVLLASGGAVGYDIASIDTGSTTATAVPGAAEHVIAIRPIERFLARWKEERVRLAALPQPRIAVAGGGVGGVELLFAVHHDMMQRRPGMTPAHFTQVSATGILDELGVAARRRLMAHLERRPVELLRDVAVTAVEAGALVLADGRRVSFDACLWATGPAAPPWLAATGLALDAAGFIAIRPTLQSESDPRVLAAGDVATMRAHPRPRSGVYAVRQGPPLARSIRALVAGRDPAEFVPQRVALALVGTGDHHAVGLRGDLAVEGRWVWQVKQWIDRRWITGFRALAARGR